jgi:hypothetical protein
MGIEVYTRHMRTFGLLREDIQQSVVIFFQKTIKDKMGLSSGDSDRRTEGYEEENPNEMAAYLAELLEGETGQARPCAPARTGRLGSEESIDAEAQVSTQDEAMEPLEGQLQPERDGQKGPETMQASEDSDSNEDSGSRQARRDLYSISADTVLLFCSLGYAEGSAGRPEESAELDIGEEGSGSGDETRSPLAKHSRWLTRRVSSSPIGDIHGAFS